MVYRGLRTLHRRAEVEEGFIRGRRKEGRKRWRDVRITEYNAGTELRDVGKEGGMLK